MTTERVTLKLRGRPLTIEAPTGGVVARAWKAGRWYEYPLLEYVQRLHLRGLAVDAGANVGNHTLWFAAACGLRVAAFEPLHGQLLRSNVARNGYGDRVQVFELALGTTVGRAAHQGKGALKTGGGSLPVAPLDSFGLLGVVLVKADVEFMEPDVLRGGETTIRRDTPVILAEVHPGHEQALADVLRPWGYRRTRRFHTKWNPTPVEEWRHVPV